MKEYTVKFRLPTGINTEGVTEGDVKTISESDYQLVKPITEVIEIKDIPEKELEIKKVTKKTGGN